MPYGKNNKSKFETMRKNKHTRLLKNQLTTSKGKGGRPYILAALASMKKEKLKLVFTSRSD